MSNALTVVQDMQSMVGSSLVASSKAVVSNTEVEKTQTGILEQLREISLKQFRAITDLAKSFKSLLQLEKIRDRRERDQATELAKENIGDGVGAGLNLESDIDLGEKLEDEFEKQGGLLKMLGISGFIAAFKKQIFDVFGSLKKRMLTLLAPFMPFINFFKKNITGPLLRLLPFLSRFGPIGLFISAVSLLIYYTDELAKALEPVVQAIKDLMKTLEPVTTVLLDVADSIIKSGIDIAGKILVVVFTSIGAVIGGLLESALFLNDLIYGIVTGDMEMISDAWKRIRGTFQTLGERLLNAIIDLANGVIDLLPIPQKAKDFLHLDKVGEGENAGADTDTSNTDIFESKKGEVAGEIDGSLYSQYKDFDANNDGQIDLQEMKKALDAEKEKTLPKTQNLDFEELDNLYPDISPVIDELQQAMDTAKLEQDKFQKFIDQQRSHFAETGTLLDGTQISVADAMKYFDSMDEMNQQMKDKILQTESQFNSALIQLNNNVDYSNDELEKFLKEKKQTKIGTLDNNNNITVVNSQPTTVNTSSALAKNDVYTGKIDVNGGDPYFDRLQYYSV